MEINIDVRARIIAVADQMYEESGRERFPSVDAVRRQAKANMNDTSAVMKEWRRQQTAAVDVVVSEVPEEVKLRFMAALQEAWKVAQGNAGEALSAAQQQWDSERGEAEDLRKELSEAYEAQSEVLEVFERELEEAKEKLTESEMACNELSAANDSLTYQCQKSESRLAEAERTLAAKDERITELKAEIAEGKKDSERRLAMTSKQHSEEMQNLRDRLETSSNEVAELRATLKATIESAKHDNERAVAQVENAQSERDSARKEAMEAHKQAGIAREEKARLNGRIEALQDEHNALLQAFPKATAKKASTPARRKNQRKPATDTGNS